VSPDLGSLNDAWGNNPLVNPELEGRSNFDVFSVFLQDCKRYSMKVIVVASGFGDGSSEEIWYTQAHPPEDSILALEWLADRFKNDDTIIGIDIRDRPSGGCSAPVGAHWNSGNADNNWKHFVEASAARILAKNPNLLIFVEGIECYNGDSTWRGGNLKGVKDYPISLGAYQKQLVYAPQEWGPTAGPQAWLVSGFNYDSLMNSHWRPEWFFIHEQGIAPIMISAWGGKSSGDNLVWMNAMVKLIANYGLSQTFWCLNPNDGNLGGLLKDDWKSWDEEKYNIIRPVLAQ
jgi:endoglucanase